MNQFEFKFILKDRFMFEPITDIGYGNNLEEAYIELFNRLSETYKEERNSLYEKTSLEMIHIFSKTGKLINSL
jgi:hypothetical protein